MSPAPREVAVVGAGVAGLATACALARHGMRVRLYERAGALTGVGAGIQISPNGLAVLDALGLGDAVRGGALAAEAVDLRDGLSGHPVLTLDLARHGKGRSWLFIHRARLIAALESGARAAGAEIRLGTPIADVREEPGRAVLIGEDGEERHADLVVGADGVNGRLRRLVEGAGAPHFTGQVAWRAIVPGMAPPRATVRMGPGRHLVTYPLPEGRINLVAVEERAAWAAESWSAEDDPETLRAAFAGFAPPVRALLDRVERVNLWGLFRHPVAGKWHSRRLVLAGDAAHPTLPFLAQGANLALEDAWALAECIAAGTADPLAAYRRRRAARAAKVVAAAQANARNYHLRPPLRGVAHGLLRAAGAVAPGAAVARFDWLYGHDETRAGGRD